MIYNEQLNILKQDQLKEVKDKILGRLGDIKREGIEELVRYLESDTDYFTAPASSKFHMNIEGGLAKHSDNVTEILLEKVERYKLNIPKESLYIAGYLHDLCKVNFYKKSMRLKKDGNTGKWIAYDTYDIEDSFPIGHGTKSVIEAQQFIKLTKEECLMIAHHMGVEKTEDSLEYYRAVEVCKGVMLLHNADAEASELLEEIYEPQTYPVEVYNEFMKQKGKR